MLPYHYTCSSVVGALNWSFQGPVFESQGQSGDFCSPSVAKLERTSYVCLIIVILEEVITSHRCTYCILILSIVPKTELGQIPMTTILTH